jgi:hypothetical protein
LVVQAGLDPRRAVRLAQVRGAAQKKGRVALRFGGGCLFWLLVSVVLSVTLTVLVNLVLRL